MLSWIERQWNEIKGNVKYGLVLAVGTGIVTGAAIVTHGLLWWQQAILVACFALLFGWAIVATLAWAKGKSGDHKSLIQPLAGTKEAEQWAYTPLQEIYDRNFHDQEVPLDGYLYTNCSWGKNVTFVYNGKTPLKLINCHFLPGCSFTIQSGNMAIKMFIEFAIYLNLFRNATYFTSDPNPLKPL